MSVQSVVFASVFQNNMVLQRDMKLPVWGKAAPGEEVTVEFSSQKKKTSADSEGNWKVVFEPIKASSKPAEMKLTSKQASVALKNILVGEVWICSGQSNMAWTLANSDGGKDELAHNASCQEIRLLQIPKTYAAEPQITIDAEWKECTAETVENFSAVAYFFGKELHRKLNVPIGLVNSSWGGSLVESWTPLKSYHADPEKYAFELKHHADASKYTLEEVNAMREELENKTRLADPGNKGEARGWASPDADLSDWRDAEVPGYLEETYGEADGAFWFRRDVEMPQSWSGKELTLRLGAVDDLDTTYFNGVKIGATGSEVPDWWAFQRVYKVPANLVRAGKNTIAVRVFDERYAGGLTGPEIKLVNGEESIDLAGVWKSIIELKITPLPIPAGLYAHHTPSYLYNAMIAPLIPFAIRGVIWYQGESNERNAEKYADLFQLMIKAWRKEWNQGNFPFLFVQLANYMTRKHDPTVTPTWAKLRESQRSALTLPNTAMAVTIDIGDAMDIHPKNKKDVGLRLAYAALNMSFGLKDVVPSGPHFKSAEILNSGKVRLKFDFADGLNFKDGDSKENFKICGADKVFKWAEAKIEGNDVIVWNYSVKSPICVRYAWNNNPTANLYNAAGLPASPFTTAEID